MTTEQVAAPKKITLGAVLGWIWTVVAGVGGVAEIASGSTGVGFFTLLSGILACPALWKAVRNNMNIEVSGWIKFGLVVGAFILAGLSAGPHREGENAQTASSPASTDSSAPPTNSPSALPKTLMDFSGTGTKSTEVFTTGASDWDLKWEYDCANFDGMAGNFQVFIRTAGGGFSANTSVNQLGHSGSDVEHYHTGGTYFLEVNSECRWHVTVTG